MGETFYEFWPRTVKGSFKSALQIETQRLKGKGKIFWSKENELLQVWGMSTAFHAALLARFGTVIIPYLATQAF